MSRRVLHPSRSRVAVCAVFAAAGLALAGCSQMSPQTTQLKYAASDGVVADAGALGVRNLLLVTDDGGEEANVVGTLVNSGGEPMSVQLGTATGGPGEPIEIPGMSSVAIGPGGERSMVVPIESGAGTLVAMIVTSGADSLDLEVPVLDGTLAEYATLTPTQAADPVSLPTTTGSESDTSDTSTTSSSATGTQSATTTSDGATSTTSATTSPTTTP